MEKIQVSLSLVKESPQITTRDGWGQSYTKGKGQAEDIPERFFSEQEGPSQDMSSEEYYETNIFHYNHQVRTNFLNMHINLFYCIMKGAIKK